MGKRHNALFFRRLWQQQRGRCYYCGSPMVHPNHPQYKSWSSIAATIDHKVPRSVGGGGGRNLVYACRKCNASKGATFEPVPGEPIREGPWEIIPYRGRVWRGHH